MSRDMQQRTLNIRRGRKSGRKPAVALALSLDNIYLMKYEKQTTADIAGESE
jgi:hypothetical protein